MDEIARLFVQVLEMAQEMKLLKLGTVCLDGTKIHANASRHSAVSCRNAADRPQRPLPDCAPTRPLRDREQVLT